MKEAEIQTKFFKIIRSAEFAFEYPEAEWVHAIPNGARVSIGQAVKLKAQGLVSGVADVFVPLPSFSPIPNSKSNMWHVNYHGMYIEFKTRTGKPSKTQDAFAEHCHRHKYIYVICRDAVVAVEALRTYLESYLMERKRKKSLAYAEKRKNTVEGQDFVIQKYC